MYKKIMAPLDGSQLAECVFPHVETLVKACKSDDRSPEVLVVQVVEPLSIPYGREESQFTLIEQVREYQTHRKTEAEKYLKEIVARFEKAGINATASVLSGQAAETLSDFAARNHVDLVVVATHGRSGISRWAWGSVADRLLRSLCVPVLMIRAPGCVTGI